MSYSIFDFESMFYSIFDLESTSTLNLTLQEELADAASKSESSVRHLATAAKHGAMAVGSTDRGAQELLLNGAKDVALGVQRLLSASMHGMYLGMRGDGAREGEGGVHSRALVCKPICCQIIRFC